MRTQPNQQAGDALHQLRRDHELIRKLLREHERLCQSAGRCPDSKADVVERLCDALCLCAQIEEEILYPTLRLVLDGEVLARTTLCDHGRLRQLIARLDEMEPGDPDYDGAVADIADCVLPSMDDAQTVLFVALRLAGLNAVALGEQMAQRRRTQLRQDFTRLGLPAGDAAEVVGGWPAACRLVRM
jgi:hypothetical protein